MVGWKKKPRSSVAARSARRGRRAAGQRRALRRADRPRSARRCPATASLMSGPTSVPASRPSPSRSVDARGHQALHELVVNPVLQDQPAGRRAALPRRAERAPQHAVEREVEIGVVEHDLRVLAAHLERQPLVHAPARLADAAARLGGAGERDDRHLRMLDDRLADHARRARARAGSPPAAGRPRAASRPARCTVCGTSSAGLKTTALPQSSAGNVFHVGIAIGKLNGVMRPHTPIGRRMLIAHLLAQLARHRVAEQAASFGGRVVRRVDAFLHVAARLGERLAHLAGHEVGDLFLARRQQVADAAQHVTAGRRRRALPALEAASRALHRAFTSATPDAGNARSGRTGRPDCDSRSTRRSSAPPTGRR